MFCGLTADYLRRRVVYDPKTGVFIWLPIPVERPHDVMWNKRFANKVAGGPRRSRMTYVYLAIRGHHYSAHRLAWLYMTGEWPRQMLDHVDGDGLNNRWSNLRLASNGQNRANARVRHDSGLGLKGVSVRTGMYRGGKYRARIHAEGRRRHLGDFDTPEAAHAAYIAAARKYFGEFARAS